MRIDYVSIVVVTFFALACGWEFRGAGTPAKIFDFMNSRGVDSEIEQDFAGRAGLKLSSPVQ